LPDSWREKSDDVSEESTKSCVVCGKLIPAKAIFCKECDHYQSAFRQILSKIDITGLIALGSTSAIIFKFLNFTFFTPPLAISAYASECGPTKFVLLFSNQGKRPGIMSNVNATRYYRYDDKRPDEDDLKITLMSDKPPLVEGGTTKFNPLSFTPLPGHEFSPPRSEAGLKTCYRVSYDIGEFGKASNQTTSVTVPCECF
jgi:hypothetical protein